MPLVLDERSCIGQTCVGAAEHSPPPLGGEGGWSEVSKSGVKRGQPACGVQGSGSSSKPVRGLMLGCHHCGAIGH